MWISTSPLIKHPGKGGFGAVLLLYRRKEAPYVPIIWHLDGQNYLPLSHGLSGSGPLETLSSGPGHYTGNDNYRPHFRNSSGFGDCRHPYRPRPAAARPAQHSFEHRERLVQHLHHSHPGYSHDGAAAHLEFCDFRHQPK